MLIIALSAYIAAVVLLLLLFKGANKLNEPKSPEKDYRV